MDMNITPRKLEKTEELLELLNDYHNYLDILFLTMSLHDK